MKQDLDFIDFINSCNYDDFIIRVDNEICKDVTNNILQYYSDLDSIMTDYSVLTYREYQQKMRILRGWIPEGYDPIEGLFDPEGVHIMDYIHYLEEYSKELESEPKVKDYISYQKKMRKFILMRAEEKKSKYNTFIPTYIYKKIFFDTMDKDLVDGIIMCFMIGSFFSKEMETRGLPAVQDFTTAKYELVTLFRCLKKNCHSLLFKQYHLLDLDYEKNIEFYTYCFIAGKLKYSYEELLQIEEQQLKEQREIEAMREEYVSKHNFRVEDYIDEEEAIMNALANGNGELYGF